MPHTEHSPFQRHQMLLLKCMEPPGKEKTDQNTILINVTLNLVLISDMMMEEEEEERGIHTHTHTHTQGIDKTMETGVKDTHVFINMELGHNLPVIQLVSILK